MGSCAWLTQSERRDVLALGDRFQELVLLLGGRLGGDYGRSDGMHPKTDRCGSAFATQLLTDPGEPKKTVSQPPLAFGNRQRGEPGVLKRANPNLRPSSLFIDRSRLRPQNFNGNLASARNDGVEVHDGNLPMVTNPEHRRKPANESTWSAMMSWMLPTGRPSCTCLVEAVGIEHRAIHLI
jgi:hypothetical protein